LSGLQRIVENDANPVADDANSGDTGTTDESGESGEGME
jgi:hypothetical protein